MRKIKGTTKSKGSGPGSVVSGVNEDASAAELARLQAKDPRTWTVSEVGKWLDFIDMSQYKIVFIENSISGAELFELETEDLTSINVRKLGHRKKILKKIGQLKKSSKAAFSPLSDNSDSDDSSGKLSGGSGGTPLGGGSTSTSSTSNNHKSKSSSGAPSQDEEITVKCFLGEDATILRVRADISHAKLRRKIRSEYKKDMEFKYKDEDDDLISITKLSHLRTAIRQCQGKPLRLYLTPHKQDYTVDFPPWDTEVLDTLVDGVVVIDKKGIIQFFNQSACEMFGYSSKAIVGKNVKALMPSSSALSHDSYIKAYLATGEAKIIGKGRKVIAMRKDQSTFPIYLSISEMRSSNKKDDVKFVGTIKDLSSTFSADTGSSEGSSSSAFAILDNILDCAIVINKDGLIQFFNKKAEELLGFTRTEVLGRNVKCLMPSPFHEQHDSYLKNYFATGEAKVLGVGREVVAQRKDGTIIPVHLSLTEQGEGDAVLFSGILRPITQADLPVGKSALQELREVLDNLIVPAIVIDDKATIHAFNQPACQLFGYNLIEVVGKNVKILMPNPDRDKHDGFVRAYMRTGKGKVIGVGRDVIALHKDGSMIPVRLSVTEKKDDNRVLFTGILQKL
ncbi:PAS domain Sbox domain containing protein [Balamuthia mandrillaris]